MTVDFVPVDQEQGRFFAEMYYFDLLPSVIEF